MKQSVIWFASVGEVQGARRRRAVFRVAVWLVFCAGLLGLAEGAAAALQDLLVASTSYPAEIKMFDGSTGSDGGTFADGGGIYFPRGLAFGPNGNLFVANEGTDAVLQFNGTTGAFVSTFVPTGGGGLAAPKGLAFSPDGSTLFVASDSAPCDILRYDASTGAFLGGIPGVGGGLTTPWGLTFGSDGDLYVVSAGTASVLRYDGSTGAFIDTFVSGGSGGLTAAQSLTFGPDGNLYVTDSIISGRVMRYDGTTGAFIDTFVAGGSGGLRRPDGLTFGPDGGLYVSSSDTSNVLRYNGATGAYLDVFASGGGLFGPSGLTFTPIPEPSTLMVLVLIGLRLAGRRRGPL